MNKTKSLEEISSSQFPPLTTEWVRDYINNKDPYHLSQILVRLNEEAFERLTKSLNTIRAPLIEKRLKEISLQLKLDEFK